MPVRMVQPMPLRRPGPADAAGRLLALRDGTGRLRRIDPAAKPLHLDRLGDDDVIRELARLIAARKKR
ncbi:MAG: hypothetical protein R3F55_20815 [Alphaproteobacteria bacterium]